MRSHRRNFIAALAVALLFLLAPLAQAQSYAGRVVYVVDGDTVDVVFKGPAALSGKHRVRLVGVDTMESSDNEKLRKDEQRLGVDRHILMYWGQTAKTRLERMIGGKDVVITQPAADKTDKYQRLLVRIYLDGRDINLQLIEEGMAMVFRKSSAFPEKQMYYEIEQHALSQRNGFWGHPAFREVPARLHIGRR